MFIRIFRRQEGKEVLLNTNHIWKIEVEQGIPPEEPGGYAFRTSVADGLSDPNAVRFYRVFIGDEEIYLVANPDDPVTRVIEKIYNEAIKGP